MQKTDLQPLDGADPDHIAVDETVVPFADERVWLDAAVDPETNRLLHFKLFEARNQAITEMNFAESREKYLVDDALFLVDSAPWFQAVLHRHGLDSKRTQPLTEIFRSELREKHLVDDATVHVDGAPWLQAACHRLGRRFQHVTHGNRCTVERIF